MKKLLFVLFFSASSMSLACTHVGYDYTGRPTYDCSGLLTGSNQSNYHHPADRGVDLHRPMRELRNEWKEQNEFNERMRNYERQRPLSEQRTTIK